MSLGKISRIIDALRYERYRFTPARRIYIDKKNAKKRPLGCRHGRINCSAKWCVSLLEAYYEPQFSGRSHGFRAGRGCHTALGEVPAPGPGRPGSSRATSPTVSGLWIIRSVSRSWRTD